MSQVTTAIESVNQQYCGFKIGENKFAIPVMQVQEIIKPQPLTPIPMAKPYIRGLMNLRGRIVTAVSLRKFFSLEEKYDSDYMNIIIHTQDSLTALVVDEILDVINIPEDSMSEAPGTIDKRLQGYVNGVYKSKQGLIILLDLKQVLNY